MRDFLSEIESLLLLVVRSLVDDLTVVSVHVNREMTPATVVVRVAPTDIGKIVGKQGRTARSIRTIVAASAQNARHPSVSIDIGSAG